VSGDIRCAVAGVAVLGRGFADWSQFLALLTGGESLENADFSAPRPQILPANERRRAPLCVKMALETSARALEMATLAADDAACVFASAWGDTELTDYLCRAVAETEVQVSPTRFHNSVHNAAVGYWTIGASCHRASSAIAAAEDTFSLALLEAALQCQSENIPVLLSVYDEPVTETLYPMMPNREAFAFSLVLHPDSAGGFGELRLSVEGAADRWPQLQAQNLDFIYRQNPAARALILAETLAAGRDRDLCLPLSDATSLQLAWRKHNDN